MSDHQATTANGKSLDDLSSAYRWYVVALLLLVHVVAHVDRQILNVLVEPVKAEFGLSDTVMGLMTGAAFAVFYAVLGIPLAYVADRFNRRNLIAASIAVWSAMTVLCGYAASALQLILARIGVAIGEAGSNPASHSIIADLFAPAKRAAPMALMAMGPNLGIMLGFIAGSLISEAYGWREAFIAVGVPGLLVALIVLFSIREPSRGHADGDSAPAGPKGGSGIRAVFSTIRRRPSLGWIITAFSLAAVFGYGSIAWLAAFFNRSYGMSEGEIGPWIGIVVGVAGSIGTLAGGLLADRLGKRDVRWRLWIICVVAVGAAPFGLAAYLVYQPWLTLALIAIPASIAVFHAGPSFALVQGLVDLRIRAVTSAFLLFVLNVVGGGLGPLYVGVMSDILEPSLGTESLRFALMSLVIPALISAACYFLATRTLKRDLEDAGTVH